MVQFLEKLLKEKTEGTQSEILYIQWGYDKKVIPAALQMVSNLFPHYSLHDESHSTTIISNIVRVLGRESITKLPAIDIWLLLESAYGHDLGMVVSGNELERTLSTEKFMQFFKSLLSDEGHSLHEFASKFTVENGKLNYQGDMNLKVNDSIKFILAEHFRVAHAERSKEIIRDPQRELDIRSPRSIISQRLFNVLGDICAAHTKPFEQVMQLPFSEVGLDDEDAHPRFIACMLRIGDLLDLDNNRFSEVMLRTLTTIPLETLKHKSKHLAIESFKVDTNEIFVSAKCEDYDVASITQHWFDYINSEVRSQMLRWKEIAPAGIGQLPTIKGLPVNLVGYEYIDGKEKPQFTVDTEKALWLLQGAGIYKEEYQAIREILQNAVDATMIRMWLENKAVLKSIVPQDEKFKEITKRYPVTLTIRESLSDDKFKEWEVSIKDNGMGISKKDLSYLKNTGSSKRNGEKNAIIEEMPAWLRPSGFFGIGFQSIFLLTDQVNLITKNLVDGRSLSIELNAPNSKKKGSIFLKKLHHDYKQDTGTCLTFLFRSEKVPTKYTVKMDKKRIATTMVRRFDPFSGDTLDVMIGHLIDEALSFQYKSEMPIIIEFGETKYEPEVGKAKFSFYDPSNGVELNIRAEKHFSSPRIETYYKNQLVGNGYRIHFLDLDINIHGDTAAAVLELNRDKIRSSYYKKLDSYLWDSLFNTITANFDRIFQSDKEKELGSIFLKYYFRDKSVALKRFNQWEEFEIYNPETRKNLKAMEVLKKAKGLKIIENTRRFNNDPESEVLSFGKDKIISYKEGSSGEPIPNILFFFALASEHFKKIIEFEQKGNSNTIVYGKGGDPDNFPFELVLNVLRIHRSDYYNNRALIPCHKDYKDLRLKTEFEISHVSIFRFDKFLRIDRHWMLSPFIMETIENKVLFLPRINKNLLEWVFQNRYDESTTFAQIEKCYDQFCSKIDLAELNKV